VDPRAVLDAVVKREKIHHCPRQEVNPGRLAPSLLTILTELSKIIQITSII
jgi:hypothetical protein